VIRQGAKPGGRESRQNPASFPRGLRKFKDRDTGPPGLVPAPGKQWQPMSSPSPRTPRTRPRRIAAAAAAGAPPRDPRRCGQAPASAAQAAGAHAPTLRR